MFLWSTPTCYVNLVDPGNAKAHFLEGVGGDLKADGVENILAEIKSRAIK